MKKKVLIFVLLGLSAVTMFLSVYSGKYKFNDYRMAEISGIDPPISFETAANRSTEEFESMFSGLSGKVTVGNDIRTVSDIREYFVDGDIPQNVGFVSGGQLISENANSCIISDTLSSELFGSYNIIGAKIRSDGKLYKICGVIKYDEKIIIRNASEGDTFSYALLFLDGKRNTYYTAQNYILSLGTRDFTILDSVFAGNIIRLIYMFPIFVSVLIIAVSLFKTALKYKDNKMIFLVSVCLISVFVLIFLVIVFHGINIPNSLIPSKWSDFGFYSQKVSEIKLEYAKLIVSPTSLFLKIKSMVSETIIYSAVSSVFLIAAFLVWHLNKKSSVIR